MPTGQDLLQSEGFIYFHIALYVNLLFIQEIKIIVPVILYGLRFFFSLQQ